LAGTLFGDIKIIEELLVERWFASATMTFAYFAKTDRDFAVFIIIIATALLRG
jgi:hypothetical protein